jgi:hypothetical protein
MAALSVPTGTITSMARWRGRETADGGDEVLVSHTGILLPRHCAFQFAGASRFGWNHHIGRVKANLGQREAEASYGLTGKQLTSSCRGRGSRSSMR